ncbi:MAG TPA: metallopeptidase family protein [Anaerolineae bacterium]|nr:metallopeptidase family protein [Anaerolineae bacterium]
MPIKLSAEEFQALVVQALDDLPEFFQEKLQNVEVVVSDWPTPAELKSVGLGPGHLLLGLYQGIPLTRRTGGYNLVLPDKITIFQGPIERICRTRQQIVDQVQHTVKHELAHHFGISDDRLRELGAY